MAIAREAIRKAGEAIRKAPRLPTYCENNETQPYISPKFEGERRREMAAIRRLQDEHKIFVVVAIFLCTGGALAARGATRENFKIVGAVFGTLYGLRLLGVWNLGNNTDTFLIGSWLLPAK